MLNEYLMKGGVKLRLGYTTGSCAAAAAKAAAFVLLTGNEIREVRLVTPKGIALDLDVEDLQILSGGEAALAGREAVSCAVRKDSGDDPDVTDGALIYAKVALSQTPGIRIEGGKGVGRVTRPGLDQPVGAAAINSTPRRMIEEAVRDVLVKYGSGEYRDGEYCGEKYLGGEYRDGEYRGGKYTVGNSILTAPGIEVTISVPRGEELAARTFNGKLGIEGGISILGTTGIVEPMSEQALLDTIKAEISVRRSEGCTILSAAPGNYGKQFFLEKYGFPLETAVTASNYIRDTIRMAQSAGFRRLLFVGHIGKLVKVAGDVPNTHSKYGDRRMEILGQIAEDVSGCELPALREELDGCVSTDEAVRILKSRGMDAPVLAEMTRRIRDVMEGWADQKMQVEVIVFSNVHGELGKTEQAEQFLEELREAARM